MTGAESSSSESAAGVPSFCLGGSWGLRMLGWLCGSASSSMSSSWMLSLLMDNLLLLSFSVLPALPALTSLCFFCKQGTVAEWGTVL